MDNKIRESVKKTVLDGVDIIETTLWTMMILLMGVWAGVYAPDVVAPLLAAGEKTLMGTVVTLFVIVMVIRIVLALQERKAKKAQQAQPAPEQA
jgi:ACR3 family arsenite efflux pump ArsB